MFGEYVPAIDPGSSNSVIGAEILGPVLQFLESTNDRFPLDRGLGAILGFLGAEAIAISRSTFNASAPRVVAVHDAEAGRCSAPLERAFVAELLGSYLDRLKTGATWSLSRHLAGSGGEPHPAVANWIRRRALKDIFVVVLESRTGHSDYLEIHLRREAGRTFEAKLDVLGPLLSRFWANRKPGLVADCLGRRKLQRVSGGNAMTSDVPLLSDLNPAGLTRSEFRVCTLVRRGLTVKAISEELALSVTTIRTHLRSIYAKTGVSGFNELAHRLIAADGLAARAQSHRMIA